MHFRILGPLEVEVDGDPTPLPAPGQRALLAILLLHPNRTVAKNTLIDAIWGDAVPQHPSTALQIVVSRLRRSLGPAAARLVSEADGYRLRVEPDELDASRAERALDDGRAALAQGDPHRAATILDGALALYRGDALDDLTAFAFRAAAERRLHEVRLALYELRNDAYLEAGRHVDVLRELDAWIDREPWRERLRTQQMLALYRSGRQAEALDAYEAFRRRLAQELGLEPGADLRELQRRILTHDPGLLVHRAGLEAHVPLLAPETIYFAGREDERERLFGLLREVTNGGSRVAFVEGEPGIGKSRLVLEVARRVGEDAIVLALRCAALQPLNIALGELLTKTCASLPDEVLRATLGAWPGDIADLAPGLRDRLPGLGAPLRATDDARLERQRSAIASWIAALSQHAPVVLVVDDIHCATPASLRLLGRIVMFGEPKRLLTIATMRNTPPDRSMSAELLVAALEREMPVERIALRGLDPKAIEFILMHMGVEDFAATARRVHRATSGHPYLVSELVRDLPSELADADPDIAVVSERIDDLVARRLRTLGFAGESVLAHAAVLARDFDAALLAEIAAVTPGQAGAVLDQALAAGILQTGQSSAFRFANQYYPASLLARADDVASLHERAARVLATRITPAAELARHWRHARSEDAHEQLMEAACRAAEEGVAALDFDAAAHWYGIAAETADGDEQRAPLLVKVATAQHTAGDAQYAVTLAEAVSLAQKLGNDGLLIDAALSCNFTWTSTPGRPNEEHIALVDRAVAAARDDATRARLLSLLALELVYSGDVGRRRELSDEALRLARNTGDSLLIAEVVARRWHALWSLHDVHDRRAETTDAVAITEGTHDVMARYIAVGTAVPARVELGEMEAAQALFDEMQEIARVHRLPVMDWANAVQRAWRTGLTGDLAAAEATVEAAFQLGERYGRREAPITRISQLAGIRWHQGRLQELTATLAGFATREATPDFEAILARALAPTVDEPRARRIVEELAADDFAALPPSPLWSTAMLALAETAYILGAADVAAAVAAALAPYEGLLVFSGSWVPSTVDRARGVAAAACGDESYERCFERSLELCQQIGAPILEANTAAWWAATDFRSGDPSRRARGERLVAHAQGLARAHDPHLLAAVEAIFEWLGAGADT